MIVATQTATASTASTTRPRSARPSTADAARPLMMRAAGTSRPRTWSDVATTHTAKDAWWRNNRLVGVPHSDPRAESGPTTPTTMPVRKLSRCMRHQAAEEVWEVALVSMVGLGWLIHAFLGMAGVVGRPLRNRSGWAW